MDEDSKLLTFFLSLFFVIFSFNGVFYEIKKFLLGITEASLTLG